MNDKQINRNHLQSEKSPYLLQHANNPVHWFPWSDDAFMHARKENKPIFLSIGYSTCHWCHVMAHESFEDSEVADLMNQTFICIKVDREERPDIDHLYMTVCQMMTGGGGWPLTIIMTPDKEPFFAGTYFPKESRMGRLGMLDLIPRIDYLWKNSTDEIRTATQQVLAALKKERHQQKGTSGDDNAISKASRQLKARFDQKYGGFGDAPKFPTPHNLRFLLRHWKHSGDVEALQMVEMTLRAMRQGGIYDHLGFGFHRYSTDQRWLVPHFEKMLYDQALLALTFLETFQTTKNEFYANTAHEIFNYIARDMTNSQGGFFSAEDADSEGEEGRFYLWSMDEIQGILDDEEFEFAKQVYNLSQEGNFDEPVSGGSGGFNILHQNYPLAELAVSFNLTEAELQERLERVRMKLFSARDKRPHPHKDKKVLTDWNGLMIAAFAFGGRVLDDMNLIQLAEKAGHFILKKLRTPSGTLFHRFKDDDASIPGNLDDYAFLIWGLTELYEATFEPFYLKEAIELMQIQLAHFWDQKVGGFFFTADDAEALLVRQKLIYDGAIPSGNTVSLMNLLRLSRMTGQVEFEKYAEKMIQIFINEIKLAPLAYTEFLNGLYFTSGLSQEIIITGDLNSTDTKDMVKVLAQNFLPNKVILFRPAFEENPPITILADFTRFHHPVNNRATIYICQDFQCQKPTNDIQEMQKLLGIEH
ncbi:thioredoxin domain-containing protein [candidate division KSB1 bacterium]|nr:thioredoxin domain-containing protein [candidate division KSB1 bacterium]